PSMSLNLFKSFLFPDLVTHRQFSPYVRSGFEASRSNIGRRPFLFPFESHSRAQATEKDK
ncbi:hypothetical protein, partial [Bradyrhizobium zhanjiangense]|uniref:hypothetical protein n=1 Tax=Bradyrhizobium zhanjiangense TaxID=1325107 RepID=UPI0019D7113B